MRAGRGSGGNGARRRMSPGGAAPITKSLENVKRGCGKRDVERARMRHKDRF